MGESEGSSRSVNLTDSGRTPLAVLLGDTSEIEREVEAALGRMSADADELELDSALAALDELGERRRRQPRRPPERRHHASAITGRIHALAQEAYALEEARRARKDEPSDRHPVLRPAPRVWVNHPAQEELVAALPWALRQHLVKPDEERERPFVLGALLGAAVAVLTAVTFLVVWTWRTPSPVLAPQAQVTPPLAAQAAPVVHPAPAKESAPDVSFGSAPMVATSVPLVPAAPPAEALTPKIAQSPVAQAPAVVPSPLAARKPRVVKEAPLAPKAVAAAPAPAESELSFDDGEGALASAAPLEDRGPPPPSQQEWDDAFEREFGGGGQGAAAADAASRRRVFVLPPVAALPATLSEGEILQTVITHKAAIASCVDAHTEASDEKRTIVLSWVLAPHGGVADVKVASEGLQGSALGRCMVDAVRAFKFAPHREAQPVRFPFSY